jgi:CO dehydrogenase/acetyl-CoA synthase beta subunit
MTGLLDSAAAALDDVVQSWRGEGRLAHAGVPRPGSSSWPRGSSLVLQDETAVELGEPTTGSLSALIWSDDTTAALPRGVTRLGPDLDELVGTRAPLGRVVRVTGVFDDDYEAYLSLQDAVHGVALEGVSVRSRPSSGQLWMRVSARAMDSGLTLESVGAALITDLEAVPGVRSAAVLWVCGDRTALQRLEPLADEADRLLGALVKRRTEDVMDCGSCEYNDICDEGAPA